jgi:hypothetical protein
MEKFWMISLAGAVEGEDDGEALGDSVVPPPGVLVGELDEDGLVCVEGLVWGEPFPVWLVFWPTVEVHAAANRNSPAPRAAALDHPPLIV